MKILVIQYPPENGKFVHPIRIDMETGAVLNQKFWKGSPLKFLGFVRGYDFREITIKYKDIKECHLKEIPGVYQPQFISNKNHLLINGCFAIVTHRRNDYTLSLMDLVEDEDPSEEPPAPQKKKTVWHEAEEVPEHTNKRILFDLPSGIRSGLLYFKPFDNAELWKIIDEENVFMIFPCRWAYWEDIKNC